MPTFSFSASTVSALRWSAYGPKLSRNTLQYHNPALSNVPNADSAGAVIASNSPRYAKRAICPPSSGCNHNATVARMSTLIFGGKSARHGAPASVGLLMPGHGARVRGLCRLPYCRPAFWPGILLNNHPLFECELAVVQLLGCARQDAPRLVVEPR